MATITINGVTYSGNNLVINGNKIMIDGLDFSPEAKIITINIEGDINMLQADVCQEIHVVKGNVGTLRTTSGDVYCTTVTENVVTTSGDVECDDIHGDVHTTSGDVTVGLISGSVSTVSGDIRYKK